MQKKIKVLHFIPGFKFGGIETTFFNIVKNINHDEYQLELLVEDLSQQHLVEEIEAYGVRVSKIPKYTYKNFFTYYKNIDEFLKGKKFDIIHSYNITRSPILFFSAIKNKISKRVFHARTSLSSTNYFKRAIFRVFIIISTKFSTHQLANSLITKDYFFGKSSAEIIPNSIQISDYIFDLNTRTAIRKKFNINQEKIVIGHVGRFTDAKNHAFIIDIMDSLRKKSKKFILLLVGDGPLMPAIQKKVKEYSLENDVIFVGSQENVSDYYQAMDFFLFPSLYEGFGNVILESQANGLNVLTSENVTKEVKVVDGIEFKSLNDSSEKWADKIIEMITLPSRQEINYNKLLKSKFNVSQNVKILEEYYRSLLHN